ncbi:MAG: SHOCT domain-containing protein [Rhizobium sp.]|nr:SHOCT domain-containing protein [Rhizobium sp.]
MRSARYRLHIFVALLAAGLGGGCSSGSTRDVSTDDRVRPAPADTYPDFSQPLDSAMSQMTDEDAARQETQLSALAQQRRAGAISPAEYRRRVEELRLLGRQANE